MADISTDQISCRVHLAAAIKNLMGKDNAALILVREVPISKDPVGMLCTCMLPAEFYIENVGRDQDEPFPLFRGL